MAQKETIEYGHNLVGFKTLLGRECHRFLRLWNQTLVPPLVTIVLYLLIFGYSLGSRITDFKNVSYMEFLVPGLVMMSVISASYQNTSTSLYIARFQCNIDELLVSSMSSFEIVLAIILGGVARGVCVGVLVTLVTVLMTKVVIANVLLALFFVVSVSVAFSSFGFLSGLWADDFDRLSLFQTYILTPFTYLGGVFFSIEMLPEVWQKVALANPILYFVNGLRYAFLGISDISLAVAIGSVLLFAIVPFLLCYVLFRRGYNIKT
jgi:ABC-2 type transport system permease protein